MECVQNGIGLTCSGDGLMQGRLGGGKVAGTGFGVDPLCGHGTGLKLPLFSGTPDSESTGFLGTTTADVDAVVVDPPSDA